MKPWERGRPPHATPTWVPPDAPFFITVCCAQKGHNSLCLPEIAPRILESASYYHELLRWNCLFLLLMPDHLHAILSFPATPGMQQTVASWKHYQSHRLGVEWQEGFFDHRVRDHHHLLEARDYILNNPLRKGLCRKPCEWPWRLQPATARPGSF